MPNSDDVWLAILEGTHKVVRNWAEEELERLARKVVYHMQRQSASGIWGDDYAYKSLWDEFCHEVQEGPTSLLESAWDQTLHDSLEAIQLRLPRETMTLLSAFAAWELDEPDAAEIIGSIWPDGLARVLKHRVSALAASRDLDRFAAWR